MNILDAIYKTIHSAAGGVEALAIRMGLRVQILRNKANTTSVTNYLNPLELSLMMELTGDYSFLHALAMNHGHVCIKVDAEVAPSDMAILESLASVWACNGAVGTEVHVALADGRLEPHEIQRIEEQVYRTIAAMKTMVARLKGMSQ